MVYLYLGASSTFSRHVFHHFHPVIQLLHLVSYSCLDTQVSTSSHLEQTKSSVSFHLLVFFDYHMSSSSSVPSSPLPFAADTHNHRSWRQTQHRSLSHQQSFASFLAAAHARAATDLGNTNNAPHLNTPSIAPSSVSSLPRSYRRLLRRHNRLFSGFLVGFYLCSILLAVAIVLAIRNATLQEKQSLKASSVIIGVIGFSGAAICAMGCWGILKNRKARSQQEADWVDLEHTKEVRQARERMREAERVRRVERRERSASGTRSVSRGRRRVSIQPMSKSASTKRAELESYPVDERQGRSERPSLPKLPSPALILPDNSHTRKGKSSTPQRTAQDGHVEAKRESLDDMSKWNNYLNKINTPSSDREANTAQSTQMAGLQNTTEPESSINKKDTTTTVSNENNSSSPPVVPAATSASNPPTTSSTLTPTSPLPVHNAYRQRTPARPGTIAFESDYEHYFADFDNLGSDDETIREARHSRSMERVGAWSANLSSGDAEIQEQEEEEQGEEQGRGGLRRAVRKVKKVMKMGGSRLFGLGR